MTDIEINNPNQEGGVSEPNKNAEPNGKPQTIDPETYKEATTELSKVAEAYIKTNIKLAEKDPKEILNMDKKIQNKVIKSLYGYNNLEELKLMQGENFYSTQDDDGEEDEIEEMKKQIKLLRYQKEKDDTEIALENFKRDNSKLFEDNPEAIDKIKTELEYISASLPAKERIERAAKISYSNYIDSTREAYLKMQEKGSGKPISLFAEGKLNRDNEISKLFDKRFKQ